jgi:hypothetical protein
MGLAKKSAPFFILRSINNENVNLKKNFYADKKQILPTLTTNYRDIIDTYL